ncbi:MAG: SGNH/GDSL hydrolase family protein [Chloroflexota bacterium]|nr:SGNH/GDSL hydrolase family protein [Chloroflexota bacterium]
MTDTTPSKIAAVRKPFTLLALGDSVMWGQGLHDHEKIPALVAAEIQRTNPTLNIETRMLAHSGAIIGEPDDLRGTPPLDGAFGGEVPIKHPTVFEQVYAALGGWERDYKVDLVLVGAGINDVHLSYILNPLDGTLETRIDEMFSLRMKPLLELCAGRFPNAKIIVSGYYPFFTHRSQRELIGLGLAALGFTIAGLPGAIGGLLIDAFMIDAVMARSTLFCERSHQQMRTCIDEMISLSPVLVDRLAFADPGFVAENAMFAPEALLYGINADLSAQDPLAEGRAAACAEFGDRLEALEKLGCPRASAGHPNAAGAARYAESIMAQMRYLLPKLFSNTHEV